MLLTLTCALLLAAPAEAPQRVTVGAYLRNVEAVHLQENAYHASFLLWVAWQGERDVTRSLRFVNLLEAWALTMSPVFDEPQVLADGRRYQRFQVEGRFFHKFELGAFPLDAQAVVVELEDAQRPAGELELEVDPASAVAPELSVPGWEVQRPRFEVTQARYEGGLGQGGPRTHARFRFGVTLQRPLRVFFVTMFPPILLVMACCWFVFFLRPVHVEARVGTVITALLTTVFLQLAFTDDLPYLGSAVLLDQVFNFSYVVITAVLAECVLVLRWVDRAAGLEQALAHMPPSERPQLEAEARRSRHLAEALDARARWLFPLAYALGCAVLLGLARGGAAAA